MSLSALLPRRTKHKVRRRHGALVLTMIKTGQWVLLSLALPMWLVARRAAPGTLARALGSWRLLLGRSVILRAVKGDPATPRLGGL